MNNILSYFYTNIRVINIASCNKIELVSKINIDNNI